MQNHVFQIYLFSQVLMFFNFSKIVFFCKAESLNIRQIKITKNDIVKQETNDKET